ncbi:unnamed protein product [Didymodactylos carnosus]|uniref:Uncharacterized protein n=1 Tax=Didymodactylos carnosus TaxID=1234261 RepID=A0A813ZVK2_9BILA|nr:unnamed protein product [Didymodactylos carnosus]CAF0903710.1 unnamed protein product [Didymodactylos carnosus]CAF3674876.1 unnamed protein product [Didymodactylos carnosus]CAF3685832.1 unnamed protein product [Didymodactylos carnosus]
MVDIKSGIMRIKGVIIITLALLLGIAALIFHFLAMFTKRWKVAIPKGVQNISNNNPHYYGFIYRHLCSSLTKVVHPCTCDYIPSTKGLQWCCILAALYLILGILVLYLKLIAAPQNASAAFLLGFVPVSLIFIALLFMLTTLILVGAYLRRDEYEDYDVILSSIPAEESVNYYRLTQYFKLNNKQNALYKQAQTEFKAYHQNNYDAHIGWSTSFEIVAFVLTFLVFMLAIFLALAKTEE